MGELFLFSFSDLGGLINGELAFFLCFIAIFILTVLCLALSLSKNNYPVKKRLWLVLSFISILLIDLWIEHFVLGQIKYLILLVAFECISLSICLFIYKKEQKISDEKKSLASFFNKCYVSQNNITPKQNCGGEIRSEVIKPNVVKDENEQDEIDFSHVKSVLKKLDFYPLKEQDKKSAKELENAIIEAEENGLDQRLKQNINDGLGALLKLMSKYAV